MSTLNALGFNVRRKRNNDTTKQQQGINKGKLINTPSLAFTSELLKEEEKEINNKNTIKSPSSIKLKQTSISKYTKKAIVNNNNNTHTHHNKRNKDSKQASLLQFLSTSTTSTSPINTTNMIENNDHSSSIIINNNNNDNTLDKKEKESMDEDSSHHYSIRHPITLSDVFPLLIESFGIYDNHSSPSSTSLTSVPLILEVKPNKKILSSTIKELNNEQMIKGIRRNRQDDDEEEEEKEEEKKDLLKEQQQHNDNNDDDDKDNESDDTTGSDLSLPSAFTKSMNFYPMKKRYCIDSTTSTTTNHHLFNDLKENYIQNDDEVYEKKDLKHRLTINQVNNLLLNIANEYLAFDDNEWCSSYIK